MSTAQNSVIQMCLIHQQVGLYFFQKPKPEDVNIKTTPQILESQEYLFGLFELNRLRVNHLLDFLSVEATAESASGGRGRGRGTGSAESAAPKATVARISATEAAVARISASESAVSGVSASEATISELGSGHGLQDTEECENHNDKHDSSSHLGWLVHFRSFRFGLLIDFGLAAYYINRFAWFNNLLIWF